MSVLKVVFVIIGTLIGAGFASGQEVYTFFYLYGIKGIDGIVLSSSLMGLIIYKTFKIIQQNNIENYDEFLEKLIKHKKIKDILKVVINIFILISFYIMVAGFGAYLNQEYNLNTTIGSGLLIIACYVTLTKNTKGLVRINEILIPILIFIIILIRYSKYKKYRIL